MPWLGTTWAAPCGGSEVGVVVGVELDPASSWCVWEGPCWPALFALAVGGVVVVVPGRAVGGFQVVVDEVDVAPVRAVGGVPVVDGEVDVVDSPVALLSASELSSGRLSWSASFTLSAVVVPGRAAGGFVGVEGEVGAVPPRAVGVVPVADGDVGVGVASSLYPDGFLIVGIGVVVVPDRVVVGFVAVDGKVVVIGVLDRVAGVCGGGSFGRGCGRPWSCRRGLRGGRRRRWCSPRSRRRGKPGGRRRCRDSLFAHCALVGFR